MRYAMGVDIGGSSAKLGLVSETGEITLRRRVPTPPGEEASTVMAGYAAAIVEMLEQAIAQDMRPLGIGIGIPGHLSDDRRRTTFNNVHILDHYPLLDDLEARFPDYPLGMDNDATLAALAEYRHGAGAGVERLLVVTLGSGVGAGLIVQGQPQSIIRGCIGDPAHILINPFSEERCSYGCRGCMETLITGSAIEREAKRAAEQEPTSQLARVLQRDACLDARTVIRLAQEGDAAARQVLAQAGHWLGLGLASWCPLYDPQVILVGGGLSAAGELLLAPARAVIAEAGTPLYTSGLRLDLAQQGNDAGVIGAACLVWPTDPHVA